MAKTAVVRARMEPELKLHAEAILERVGIKPSEAINLFYRQVEQAGGLPFGVNNDRAALELSEDMQRLAECREGQYVEHDAVDAWLRSIGSADLRGCSKPAGVAQPLPPDG